MQAAISDKLGSFYSEVSIGRTLLLIRIDEKSLTIGANVDFKDSCSVRTTEGRGSNTAAESIHTNTNIAEISESHVGYQMTDKKRFRKRRRGYSRKHNRLVFGSYKES